MPIPDWLPFLLACTAGGMLRFAVAGAVARRWGGNFPLGTLVVNLTGALALGLVAGLPGGQGWLAAPEAWLVVVTGFLGSYTTVSSFSLQTLSLVHEGHAARALANSGSRWRRWRSTCWSAWAARWAARCAGSSRWRWVGATGPGPRCWPISAGRW